ncbi:ankyrin repeat domain-containing protein [Aeoliella sp. ICT_H6.2]|uniref:Ankyrin repeat domain-containing protein n=2 Tax=Aeoliella straminimaris TaxID=2954799 RepID=A0A9X2JIP8_9BACT|nr:ankyrin repeat domain-containing protein [Aeoliella straminimaris]
MKQDPTWVARRDSRQRTPLHVAARFNHKDVVVWLLENGADVEAQAYNRFTPLHVTKNPEIVELILGKKPNLQLESVSGTVLQSAIDDLRHCIEIAERSPTMRQQTADLRKIVDMYVDHLGDDIDLISAVRLGQLHTVKNLVGRNPSAAHGQEHGPNPLREAANWGHLDICKFLIEEHQVDVDDFEGGTGYPIIKTALKYPDIVKYLIEQGANLETRITWRGGRTGVWIIGDDATALHFAARDGVPETITILLDAGVDVFATAHDPLDEEVNQSALDVAAYFGKTDNAMAILHHSQFNDARGKLRQEVLDRSLAIASYPSWLAFEAQDRSELIDALITHGANARTTGDKRSPIQIAVSGIHPEDNAKNESIKKMVSVLRKHGAELDVFSAVAIGDSDALAKLLEKDPKVSISYSIEGYPAMHMAIQMNYPKAVKMLLDAGCDVEIKSKSESHGWDEETPLLCAAFWGHDEIAKMLVRAGANVNAKTESGVTPLHEAVRLGHVAVAKLLLENGANQEAKDQKGKIPLEWASNQASAEEFTALFSKFEEFPTE